MGAPAISTAPRRAKTTAKPRQATKPRPAAKPRSGAAAKPRPRTAAKPRARASTAAKPRAAATKRKPTTARAAAPRRARTAPRPRTATAGNVALFPVAAVSGLADSGLVTRMTRGRVWIFLLAILLGGIVAINVVGLGLSASSSATESRIDGFQSDNGILRSRIAQLLSTEVIQENAASDGLAIPPPDAIHYVDHNDADFAKAAKRLAAGEITLGEPTLEASATDDVTADPTAATTETTDPAVTADPAATTVSAEPIIDPNTGLPAVDPATGAPITAVDPVTGEGVVGP